MSVLSALWPDLLRDSGCHVLIQSGSAAGTTGDTAATSTDDVPASACVVVVVAVTLIAHCYALNVAHYSVVS